MANINRNRTEEGVVGYLDRKNSGQSMPDQAVFRSPEQAMFADAKMFADQIVAIKNLKMKDAVLGDLRIAQIGMAEQVEKARERLAKFGIDKSKPPEFLGLIESAISDAALAKGVDQAFGNNPNGLSPKGKSAKEELDRLLPN